MRHWILIIATQLILLQYVSAQDQVGCLQLLEDAKEAYAAGMVELVPELLVPCIETGLSGKPKQEAYKLVISAYLFDYLPDQADNLMSDFMDEYPDYKADPIDPSEFRILLATHQQIRDEQLAVVEPEIEEEKPDRTEEKPDRTEERPDRTEEKEKEKVKRERKPVPVSGQEQGAAAGFTLGTNHSFPTLVEPYSLANASEAVGEYDKATSGFHLGGAFTLKLSRGIYTDIEVWYQRSRLNYTAVPYSFTHYEYKEVQNRFGIPVSLLFALNPDSRSQVYLRLGIMADYMLSAGASAVRTYTELGNTASDVVLDQTDISDSRSRMNLYGLGGLGIKFPIQKGYVFIESRFQYGIFKSNKLSERYNNQDLIWLIYHVDNDFRVSQLNFSAGMKFYLR